MDPRLQRTPPLYLNLIDQVFIRRVGVVLQELDDDLTYVDLLLHHAEHWRVLWVGIHQDVFGKGWSEQKRFLKSSWNLKAAMVAKGQR